MSRATDVIRGWRWPAVAALGVIAAGVVISMLQPAPAGYLDPNGTGPAGGHALADLLAARGQQVDRAGAPVSAGSGERGAPLPSGGQGGQGRELELVTSPELLTSAQLAQAGQFQGDILLVDPDAAALRAIAPKVDLAGTLDDVGGYAQPDCTAQSAALAGDAYLGGPELRTADPAAQMCYRGGNGGYHLVRYSDGSRTITVLGSGALLTNQYLAQHGDAALALNLARTASRVVWLVPSAVAQVPGAAGSGNRSFWSLVPWPAYLVALQLGVAVLVAALWRARRFGPLVAERLAVVVRASETVEGHGRLYQARRARDRAAEELRAAASGRIARLTGGPGVTGGTSAAGIAAMLAARTGQDPAEVASLLHGPPPTTDEALVALAADLDTLERKIRQP